MSHNLEETFNPYEAESPKVLSEKLRADIVARFAGLKIVEHPYKDQDEGGNSTDTFFIEYPIRDGMYLRSVVKIPNDDEFSVQNLHHEAQMYELLDAKVDCIPNFLGFNNSAEILHVAFMYSSGKTEYESYAQLLRERPVETTVSLLEAFQQLHKQGVVHNDIFLYSNTLTVEKPGGDLKTIIYDLAIAENYSHPDTNKEFERDRRYELREVFSILPIFVQVQHKEIDSRDTERIVQEMVQLGLSDTLARKIHGLSKIFTDYSPSIAEVDELIAELRECMPRRTTNSSKDVTLLEDSSAFSNAMNEMNEVNRFLMAY